MNLPTLEQVHNRWIFTVIRQTRTLAEAAAVLGIDQATLYRWRKRYGTPSRRRGDALQNKKPHDNEKDSSNT